MELIRTQTTDLDRTDALGMQHHLAYVETLVDRGGPISSEYAAFNVWLDDVAADLRIGGMSVADLAALRRAFGPALSSTKTLQGLSYSKPRGYSGDFEIIDRLYRHYVTTDSHLRNWDLYCQSQSAASAVRNRKSYFISLLHRIQKENHGVEIPILNLASGPCRDVFEFFSLHGQNGSRMKFECVDSDADAIDFGKSVCASYLDDVQFIKANALRFVSERPYRLIWSAGLFDYLGDRAFKFLLEHLLTMLEDGGEAVIGNFSKENPSRPYMEIVADWHLYHRSESELIALARNCGVAERDIYIGREPEGVNLFLHIKKGADFLG